MRDRKKQAAPVAPGAVPARSWRRRVVVVGAWLAIAAAGYTYGRFGSVGPAHAQTQTPARPGQAAAHDERPAGDYQRRIVAYIHGNIPITREELGEYLIARHGKEKLNLLINKRIIEHAARMKGIDVTDAEVEASVKADAQQLGVSVSDFSNQVLRRYQKTIYEWKEDVTRPRLIMEKMCRARVTVTGEDLAQAFEAYFGEKVDCKMIMWPHEEKKVVTHKIWPKIRNDEKEFDSAARMQASPSLAAVGGHIKPLGRHCTGNPHIEKTLFNLKPGEVSEVLDTPEGVVVFKCIRHIPPDTTASYEQRKPALEKEVFDRKVALEIGKVFQELRAQAQPQDLLNPPNIVENARRELQSVPTMKPDDKNASPFKPQGN